MEFIIILYIYKLDKNQQHWEQRGNEVFFFSCASARLNGKKPILHKFSCKKIILTTVVVFLN